MMLSQESDGLYIAGNVMFRVCRSFVCRVFLVYLISMYSFFDRGERANTFSEACSANSGDSVLSK